MKAIGALNAALTSTRAAVRTLEQHVQRAHAASGAAVLATVLLDVDVEKRHLKLPRATLDALVGGVALSLQAGAATVADLFAAATRTGDDALRRIAKVAANHHLRSVATCLTFCYTKLNDAETFELVTAWLDPPDLVALLDSLTPPLLWEEVERRRMADAAGGDPQEAVSHTLWLTTVLGVVVTPGAYYTGIIALEQRPARLQRGLARLLACRLRTLASMRNMQGDDEYHWAVHSSLRTLQHLAFVIEPPAPWAHWTASQAAASVLDLGVQQPASVNGSQHNALVFKAAGRAMQSVAKCMSWIVRSASSPVDYKGLPCQLTDALARVAAALMVVADSVLLEPRFQGAERVLGELGAVPFPWDEGPPAAAPTQFAAPAEACAALEMAARLLASLPEVLERLPSELQDMSPGSASGQLADQLWAALHCGCKLVVPQEAGEDVGGGADADLVASVAKLAGRGIFAGPVHAKYCLSVMLGGPMQLLRWSCQPLHVEGDGSGSEDRFSAAALAAVGTTRTILALLLCEPKVEVPVLTFVEGLTCRILSPRPALARLVARHGGFELLAVQVAVVCNPVRC
jgi:hypothetical protein